MSRHYLRPGLKSGLDRCLTKGETSKTRDRGYRVGSYEVGTSPSPWWLGDPTLRRESSGPKFGSQTADPIPTRDETNPFPKYYRKRRGPWVPLVDGVTLPSPIWDTHTSGRSRGRVPANEPHPRTLCHPRGRWDPRLEKGQ